MQTSYKQQLSVLQDILQELEPLSDKYLAVNDAAGTIYAKMLEPANGPSDYPHVLLETAILHCEQKLKGKDIKLAHTLEILYKLRTALRAEEREYMRKDNVLMVILFVLSTLGLVFLLQLALSFW